MKYPHGLLGFIAFMAAMIWTWNVIHEEPSIALETHSGIQEKLSQLIVDTVKSHKATADEVNVERIWTEPVGEHRIKAFFIYSFVESPGEGADASQKIHTRIQGQGILDEQENDGTGKDRWKLSQVKTTQDAISFEDAIVVTGDDAKVTETKENDESAGEGKKDEVKGNETKAHEPQNNKADGGDSKKDEKR